MTPAIRLCAWCLRGTPPTLTVLDGTPPELALLALEADDAESISHGMCDGHRVQSRQLAGLSA